MLWNVVFEFYVKYIFGGVLSSSSSGSYAGILGHYYDSDLGSWLPLNTWNYSVELFGINIPFGNYLSLIATIISMVAIVVLACLFIKKIYNICAHVIG